MKRRLRIAVLAGGVSAERDVSLASGKEVQKALKKLGHRVYFYDPKFSLNRLFRDRKNIDLVFPILHGPKGEDGTIQGFLEMLGLPYVFSNILTSALGMDKLLQRQIFTQNQILVPPYQVLLSPASKIKFSLPVVIKPNNQGSSLGVSVCFKQGDLGSALKQAFGYSQVVLVEKYIKGKEISVGVLGEGKKAEVLPVAEIVPSQAFFDYQAKYDGATREIVPAPLSQTLYFEAQSIALKVHQILRCVDLSRTDMILAGQRIYVLEVNTIPGFTKQSLVPKMARALGLKFEDLVSRIIEFAIQRYSL